MDKCVGLVLKKTDDLNGDRRIVFLDKELGKIHILIKGIIKSKNREIYSTDILVFSEFIVTKGIASSVCLLDSLRELKKDKLKLKVSLYILDVLDKITVFRNGSELYILTKDILFGLKSLELNYDILSALLIFLYSSINILGLSYKIDDLQRKYLKEQFDDSTIENFSKFLENIDNFKLSSYTLRELCILIRFLEIHMNSNLETNIYFMKYMKGFIKNGEIY